MKANRIFMKVMWMPALVVVVALLPCSVLAASKATFNEQLIKVTADGDLESVKAILDKGADVNAKNEYGITALTEAAVRGNLHMIKLLISKGANVNSQERGGLTALMHAVNSGKVDIVKALVDGGADINVRDEQGQTALMKACGGSPIKFNKNFGPIVSLLLQHNADVNVKDKDGGTALMYAAQCLKADSVNNLINKGADYRAKDNSGNSVFVYAAKGRDVGVAKLLLDKGFDVNNSSKDGVTPIMVAASGGNPATIKLLIEKGADVNAQDADGRTALMRALVAPIGSLEKANLLLNKGADVNAKDKQGRTALIQILGPIFQVTSMQSASSSGKSMRFVKAKSQYGSPLLLDSPPHRCKDMVKLLIKKGANVQATDKSGRSALVYAMSHLIEIEGDTMFVSRDTDDMKITVDKGTIRIKDDALPEDIRKLLMTQKHGAK